MIKRGRRVWLLYVPAFIFILTGFYLFRILQNYKLLSFVIPYIIILIRFEKGRETMEYMSCAEAAGKWGISERRVQKLCEENRIPGVSKFGKVWLIP